MGTVGGIGAKLLSKMGWAEGTGLGARRDGQVEPLGLAKRGEKLGIGAERRPFQDAWWEKAMEDAYGKAQGDGNDDEDGADDDLLHACEGRRCRPHGSAKLARLEAQDRLQTRAKTEVEKPETRKAKKKARKLKVQNEALRKERKKKRRKKIKAKEKGRAEI